jgi:hypothetical protein
MTPAGTVRVQPQQKGQQQQGVARRQRDRATGARLLDLDGMADYLGISRWSAEELVRGGHVPVTRIPRPKTARALKHDPEGDELRVLRVDKADLDDFIERQCRKERLGVLPPEGPR